MAKATDSNIAHRITRDGERDLGFTGRVVGAGTCGTGGSSGYACDWNRGTDVNIYLTVGGRIVTAVHQWSMWQGERDSYRAAVHDTPAAALVWLVEDAGGELGPASKEAWEEACSEAPELAGQDVEEVS
jgi:hypothetical protein